MKKYLISILAIVSGVICHITFWIIGSEVASDGVLVEPFALIPVGYMFYAFGAVLGIYTFIKNKTR